jgi:hypothetical protein
LQQEQQWVVPLVQAVMGLAQAVQGQGLVLPQHKVLVVLVPLLVLGVRPGLVLQLNWPWLLPTWHLGRQASWATSCRA